MCCAVLCCVQDCLITPEQLDEFRGLEQEVASRDAKIKVSHDESALSHH